MSDDAAVEASAMLMGEIYASLAIHATLAAEIQHLESEMTQLDVERDMAPIHLEVAAEAVNAAAADAKAMEQAVVEAMEAAAHEREMRMRASSKLRLLQHRKNEDGHLLAELDAERKRGQARERELRDARTRAQQATERHSAASHKLRAEQQQAQRLRATAAARQLLSLWRHDAGRALQRGFLTWRAMIAAGLHVACLPEPRTSARDEASAMLQVHDEAAHDTLRAALHARGAECVCLRNRVVELEAELALQDDRDAALFRASDRAAQLSAALLDARHEQARLTELLTAARLELRRRDEFAAAGV